METQPQNNLNQPLAPLEPSAPVKKVGIKFGLSIAVIIILAVAAGVAVYWIKTEPIEPTGGNANIKKTNDKTASWQNYRNDSFGFEFKHPNTWQIKTSQNGISNSITLKDTKNGYAGNDFIVLTVTFMPNQAGITIDEWWTEAGKDSAYKKTGETTIASRRALVLEITNSEAGQRYIFTSIEKGGYIFDVSTVALSKEVINQILSTFKFCNLTDNLVRNQETGKCGFFSTSCDVPASGWIVDKTCKDEKTIIDMRKIY